MKFIYSTIFVFSIVFLTTKCDAQDSFTVFLMPTVSINYDLGKKISQTIDFESRNFGYLDDKLQLKAVHLELLNTTKFQFSDTKQVGFGIRYRVESDRAEEDEVRLHQEYEWKQKSKSLLKHRLRLEERIYASHIRYRLRYRTGFNIEPKTFCDVIYIANEFTFETARNNRSEYEERVLVEAEWDLSCKSQVSMTSQYRFSDFTKDREHNVFFTAKLSFDL